jgi:hypothetical protein
MTILSEYKFVFDIYVFCSNGYSSSTIDEEGAPVICETTCHGCSDNHGGKSIDWRHGDCSKQSASTFRNFEEVSNVTDVSDWLLEKQELNTTSTDVGISIVFKSLSANVDSSIRCNLEFDSNIIDITDVQL